MFIHNLHKVEFIHCRLARPAFQKLEQYVSDEAFHDSSARYPPPKCHPRTREQVLERIKDWIQGKATRESRILWLYGSAGVGKSAIAQTIAEYCVSDDKLGAAFFFARGDSNRNNAYQLFPTLAWQLSSYIPEVKERISTLMRKDPLVPTRSIEAQFEQLIVQSFQGTADGSPPISTSRTVIIDGVDECVDEMAQQRFLTLLLDAIDGEKVPLRFLVCSRPESHIKEAFHQRSAICRLVLDDDSGSYEGIRAYLTAEFSRISSERRIGSDRTWPPAAGVLDQLVQNSSGQFIYAATIVKFVGDKYTHPGKQLDIVLGIRRRSGSSSLPFADLDQLYLEILSRQPDQYFLKIFLSIMCMCLEGSEWKIKEDDLPMLSIVLLKLAEGELWAKLRGLHSLLNISDLSIRLYHASFLDFLRDAERSSEYHFDRASWPRAFVELFLEAVVEYVRELPTTRVRVFIYQLYDDILTKLPSARQTQFHLSFPEHPIVNISTSAYSSGPVRSLCSSNTFYRCHYPNVFRACSAA